MTLQEICERVGSKKINLIKTYVNDGLREIQSLIPEKTTYEKITVVADQRLYSFPANMVKLLGVYRKYDDEGKYVKIGRIAHLDLTQSASSTATDAEVDIIVV